MKLQRQWLVCLLAAAGMWTQAGSISLAQQAKFAQRPIPQNYSDSAAIAAVKEAGPLSAQSKDTIRLMVDYYMSQMTDPKKSDVQRGRLESALRMMGSADGSKVAAEKVVEISKTILNLQANYHPSVRVNATLLLAELDEGERNARVPSEAASAILFPMAVQAAGKPNMFPCHLRSLALLGLERHVRAMKPTPQNLKDVKARIDTIAGKMMEIIASQPVSIPEEKAHWWMVRRAYDVLDATQLVANQIPEKDRKTLVSPPKAMLQALDLFMAPDTLPSVRLSAGKFLTNFDFSGAKVMTADNKEDKQKSLENEVLRSRMFVAVALLLDKEVVGWYEAENDKTRMQSGAMMGGGMGGMGGMMGGSGMMGGDDGGGMMGGMMGGGEMGSMGGGGRYGSEGGVPGRGENSGPKPIDTQTWDLRQNRRKLNTYCQLAHTLLEGNQADGERDVNQSGKGAMETKLPSNSERAGKKLIEALEEVQTIINERNLTTTGSLMSRSRKQLTLLREACELIEPLREPAPENVDPKAPAVDKDKLPILVASFKELSPRMQSFKKADMSGALETPAGEVPPPTKPEDGTAAPGAEGGAPADAAAPGPAQVPAAGQPAAGQPAAGQPAADSAPAAGNAPAATQPGAAPAAPAATAGQQ